MPKPRFGLHWVVAFFLMGFGGALIWARLNSSAASQLHRIGLTPDALGYAIILSGLLMLMSNNQRVQIACTFVLMPYTLASLLLFFENGTVQSFTIFLFIQVAMIIVIKANDGYYGR